jgi:3-carboxy-cis,cis-muconate cycloisomerase
MATLIFESFLSTPAMLAAFDAPAIVQGMLDFEAALARAQAAEGMIPAAAADAIAAACRVQRFDLEDIASTGSVAGTLAIPLVRQLTAAVREGSAEAAGYVHWGSTSQDVIDTAMALATRRALALIDADLGRLVDALRELVRRHGDAPMLGRTLLQPAQVISFGFKLVAWIAPLERARARLHLAARTALQLQLGGAVGTLSVMATQAPGVARRMADELGLALPPGAWHTQRDEWVRLGCEVGVLAGSLGKVATDIALLAQGEIAEVAEPAGGGRGGSSAMPHKRNPVASMIALAAAIRTPQRVAALLAAMPQQHERGLGNWQAELAEWPGLFLSTHGALQALADAAEGLVVDPVRMRANIDALQGLVFTEAVAMCFARHIGKARAHALLEALSRRAVAERRHLREVTLDALAADADLAAQVSTAEVDAAFDADAAARHASAIARPQLDALAASH